MDNIYVVCISIIFFKQSGLKNTQNSNVWNDVSMSQQTRSDTKSGQDYLVRTRHMHMDPPYLIQVNNLDSLLYNTLKF